MVPGTSSSSKLLQLFVHNLFPTYMNIIYYSLCWYELWIKLSVLPLCIIVLSSYHLTGICVSGCQESDRSFSKCWNCLACLPYQSALKKKQLHIQLELVAGLQVLSYLRCNRFYFSCCVAYIKPVFTLAERKAVFALGRIFTLFLAFLFL